MDLGWHSLEEVHFAVEHAALCNCGSESQGCSHWMWKVV